MVEVIYNGNLGNNLFQYCFGRILAHAMGYKLKAEPIPGFAGTYDRVDGHDYANESTIVLRGQKPDLGFVRTGKDPRCRILLTGYFQRYEYYRPHAGAIRKWLALEDSIKADIGDRDVVLSIRRGRDYIPRYGLPLSYYEQALASMEYRDVHICTNQPEDPFVRHLARKYRALIRPGSFRDGRLSPDYLSGALDNLVFIKKFRKIIISNSSFAWWAAYLSDASQIAYPRPANGMWSAADPVSRNIDLEVDEGRYQYLSCEKYKSEFTSEVLRIAWERAVHGAKAGLKAGFPFLAKRSPKVKEGAAYRFEEEGDRQADAPGGQR